MGYKKILLLIFLVYEVNPMALKGPSLTRYDPCGLGVIHFDTLSERLWRGVVQFGLYSRMVKAEMEMVFKKAVTISAHPDPTATSVSVRRTSKHNFMIHAVKPIPTEYIFYVNIDNSTSTEPDVPYIDNLVLNNVTLCNDQIKASQTVTSLNVTKRFDGVTYAHVCGRRAIDHEELVSVRTEAKAGDWPWHVALLIKDEVTGIPKYHCGGNIVSRTAIVTAGHCVSKKGKLLEPHRLVVVAGIDNHKEMDQPGRQTLIAKDIILHPAYSDDTSTSDLAIIRIRGLNFTEYVQPICIWGPVYDKRNLFGKEATVVGFGSTEHDQISDELRSTYIMVQNDTTCINYDPKLYTNLMNEFTICAGYGPTAGINPRNGDSGGGLVVSTIQQDHKISWFLRGVLSKCGTTGGSKMCNPNYYVIYTDVGPHYGWIYHHAGLQFKNNIMFI